MAQPFDYDRAGYTISAQSASGTGSAIDMRGSRGAFIFWLSGSAGGAAALTANASAIVNVQHSIDGVNGWTTLGVALTASATAGVAGIVTAQFSGGAYGYVRGFVSAVYSAAQTGTGVVYAYILPGLN